MNVRILSVQALVHAVQRLATEQQYVSIFHNSYALRKVENIKETTPSVLQKPVQSAGIRVSRTAQNAARTVNLNVRQKELAVSVDG